MKFRKERYMKVRRKDGKMQADHEKLVQRIIDDPTLIKIDNIPVDVQSIRKIEKEFWCGYRVDLAIIREIEPSIAEIDLLDVCNVDYGKSIVRHYEHSRKKLLPFVKYNPKDFNKRIREKLGFNPDYYKDLWLDVLISYLGPLGLIETERVPHLERMSIPIYRENERPGGKLPNSSYPT